MSTLFCFAYLAASAQAAPLVESSSKTTNAKKATSISKAASTRKATSTRKAASSSKSSAADIAKGKSLFKSYDCAACHRVAETGCEYGVSLDGIGKKRSEQFLFDQLKDPEEHVAKNQKQFPDSPTNMMPKPDLETAEIKLIIKYLKTL